MTMTRNETSIEAVPDLPVIRITRDFDAPPETVYRAWSEPELVKRWMGPRSIDMDIEEWDCRRGGSYRYTARREGEEVARFYGSFHDARPGERIVQTFTFEGVPDGVSLDTVVFTPLDGGRRCRSVVTSVVETLEGRDAILASGMDTGVSEGYEQLDELIAAGFESGAGRGTGSGAAEGRA
jgi:uncharacterized protein YndB with AHSA1/START domain